MSSSFKNSFPSLICVDSFDDNKLFALCLNNNGEVFTIGSIYNKIHTNENKEILPIIQIKNLTNITMISCGFGHSICLNFNGDIFSFGRNNQKQLGIGKDTNELEQTYIPQKIDLPPCKQVSCGAYFTVCITEDNELFAFGKNNKGYLGLGNNNAYYSSPQLIPGINNIEFVICGAYHSICKTYNNEFYSWGYNYTSQLGQGNNNKSCNRPNKCSDWPDNIISIKCGDWHSLLLTSEGQIYSFGDNSFGQLGLNDKIIKKINIPTLINDIPEIQRIECGDHHSMCIDINNNLWIFGVNYYGQLGLGDKEKRYKPVIHPTLSNIIDISSRGEHTFVKTIDNKIYAFGNNEYSQLGIKTSEKKQLTPIRVLEDNEEIWCSFIGKSRAKSARK